MKNIDWTSRRSDKTTWMIDQLVDEVVLGQSLATVIGQTRRHGLSLLPLVVEKLNKIDNSCEIVKNNKILWCGSEIVFAGANCNLDGYKGSQYWDHYAVEDKL